MSDLYNSQTYTFDELRQKHKDFAVPSYKITVCGKDIAQKLNCYADNISVTQTISAESGSCRFKISSAYDLKQQSFKSSFSKDFPLGGAVEVSLGYVTPLVIFKGFIGDVAFSFSSGSPPSANITCFDIRMLMMQGQKNVMLVKAPFKTVLDKIFEDYSSSIELKFDCSDSFNDEESFNQNTNDFKYIYDYAISHGYEFFVLGDKAYFQKKQTEASPLITLKWGENVDSFSYNYSYNSFKIKGALTLPPERKAVTEEAETKSIYKQTSVTNNSIVINSATTQAKNPADLKSIVQNKVKQREEKSRGGSVSCIGIPEIIPGRFLKLEKFDNNFLDGSYYINSVTHEYSSSGYSVSMDLSERSTMEGEIVQRLAEVEPKAQAVKPTHEKINHPLVGVVINNHDDEHPACVQVEIPNFPEEMRILSWARVAVPFAGEEQGFYYLPEVGDEVIVMFCNGEIDRPIVTGVLFNEKSKLLEAMKNEENNKKCFKTRAGHIINFDDTKDKTSIEIKSATELTIKLDDESKTITLSDSKAENTIALNETDGLVSLTAKNKITLIAGTTELVLDGQGKKAELKSDSIGVKPSQTLTLEGQQINIKGQQIKLDGQQTNIKGQTMAVEAGAQLELKSSGVANLKGAMVKLN